MLSLSYRFFPSSLATRPLVSCVELCETTNTYWTPCAWAHVRYISIEALSDSWHLAPNKKGKKALTIQTDKSGRKLKQKRIQQRRTLVRGAKPSLRQRQRGRRLRHHVQSDGSRLPEGTTVTILLDFLAFFLIEKIAF